MRSPGSMSVANVPSGRSLQRSSRGCGRDLPAHFRSRRCRCGGNRNEDRHALRVDRRAGLRGRGQRGDARDPRARGARQAALRV